MSAPLKDDEYSQIKAPPLAKNYCDDSVGPKVAWGVKGATGGACVVEHNLFPYAVDNQRDVLLQLVTLQ
jgi:hypothetical protein